MLKIDSVYFSIGNLDISNNISMEIQKNSITSLIGPNGAGKTTLFNIIAGIYHPSSGEIILDGEKITGLKPYEICKKGISRTYQVIKLFDKMTVLDNVLVGMHTKYNTNIFQDIFHSKKSREKNIELNKKAYEIIKEVGLINAINIKAGTLSYGQQRLLEIARAIASDPKIVLLDEPAAGMNSTEKSTLAKFLKKIVETMNITLLLVEHDIKFVTDISDKIYVLNSGKIIASGSPKEIINNKIVIDAYLGKEE